MHILVTGGAGYIGSHTCLELLRSGRQVTVLDNLSNSTAESLRRVSGLANAEVPLVQGDIRDGSLLRRLFAENVFDGVIHFAGLKAVGESVQKPLLYWDNNVVGTIVLLDAMRDAGVNTFVFSSSATVYGDQKVVPIPEQASLGPTNPYGQSKLAVETVLGDLSEGEEPWSLCSLRYFNPVGADPSGQIGEDPSGVPSNLAPFITQVALGKREQLSVFGMDYETRDGTGVRDYIHVTDLARGHLAALDFLVGRQGHHIFNLGRGDGVSVLELVDAFERATGRAISWQGVGRRPGDVAVSFSDPGKANRLLGWEASRGVDEMAVDAWRWQSLNPNGYRGDSADNGVE